jgi:signal transduction histidine kinase
MQPLSHKSSLESKARPGEPRIDQFDPVYRKRPAMKPTPGWANGVHLESLANLAHELRTPVQVLLGYLDILRDYRAGAQRNESRDPIDHEIVERMNSKVHELAQTVENVMDFALAQAHAETATEEEIDLVLFFAELDPILKAANQHKSLAITIDLGGVRHTVGSSRHALRAIVVNLAINAIKFTEAGEVAIRVRTSLRENGGALEIEVRDTGLGISRELLSHAFEPLIQLSHSSGRHHPGLGLGLTVVQRNVTALGAKLRVESTPNVGSCFRVSIPCKLSEPGLH